MIPLTRCPPRPILFIGALGYPSKVSQDSSGLLWILNRNAPCVLASTIPSFSPCPLLFCVQFSSVQAMEPDW